MEEVSTQESPTLLLTLPEQAEAPLVENKRRRTSTSQNSRRLSDGDIRRTDIHRGDKRQSQSISPMRKTTGALTEIPVLDGTIMSGTLHLTMEQSSFDLKGKQVMNDMECSTGSMVGTRRLQ